MLTFPVKHCGHCGRSMKPKIQRTPIYDKGGRLFMDRAEIRYSCRPWLLGFHGEWHYAVDLNEGVLYPLLDLD